MAAASLPLELQQHIFQYLDPRSFYASRRVCWWWHHASQDSVTLASQLQRLPVKPLVSAKTFGSECLESLYHGAARSLLLGTRVTAEEDGGQSRAAKLDKAKIAVSRDGKRAATLEDREITLYDLESPQCAVISRRPLNDLRTAIGGGPWFKCAPTCVYELALSANGNILAIALERTIQIYNLEAEEDSWPVASYIPSASGHYIAGLQFQHNDSLLRVQLSNKGAVVYLGTPQDSAQGLKHWQGKGGLKHAYLDSTKAVLRPLSSTRVPETLAGLQLLRPFENGWLFAAQKHCATTYSSCYCIGHVTSSEMHGHVATVEKHAIILAKLSSSSPLPEIVQEVWQNLPSCQVQHPEFSLSPDNSLLAMCENIDMSTSSSDFSRVFVFRLPTFRHLLNSLESIRTDDLKHAELQSVPSDRFPKQTHNVQSLPLSIGTLKGKILGFEFESPKLSDACGQYQISAVTELGPKTWSLLDS